MIPDTGKTVLDVTAVGVGAGALIQILPAIAAGFTIVWLSIRIWETDTVRKWTKRNS